MVRFLEREGFALLRVRGSHHFFQRQSFARPCRCTATARSRSARCAAFFATSRCRQENSRSDSASDRRASIQCRRVNALDAARVVLSLAAIAVSTTVAHAAPSLASRRLSRHLVHEPADRRRVPLQVQRRARHVSAAACADRRSTARRRTRRSSATAARRASRTNWRAWFRTSTMRPAWCRGRASCSSSRRTMRTRIRRCRSTTRATCGCSATRTARRRIRTSFAARCRTRIDEFEQVARTNFSYSQPWFVPGEGFLFLHTRYHDGRRLLHWMTSRDGRAWSAPQPLAQVAQGHYQISSRHGRTRGDGVQLPSHEGRPERPHESVLPAKRDDMGATWRTAAGEVASTPLTDAHNAALVHDYEAEGKLVYLKDLNFDAAGRPVILYLTADGYAPGPASGERQWFTAHWTGETWRRRPFTTSDHNYDYGAALHRRRRVADHRPDRARPAAPRRRRRDGLVDEPRRRRARGRKQRQLTRDSRFNHTYARRPVDAHPQFYALWADGNPLAPSESRLYFTDRDGTASGSCPSRRTRNLQRRRPFDEPAGFATNRWLDYDYVSSGAYCARNRLRRPPCLSERVSC